MRGPHNIIRLVRTLATLERTGAIGQVLAAMDAPPRLRAIARILGWPFKWLGLKGDPSLPPTTRALTALGPAYIKFGQILSTRPDIVGGELAQQLKYLQDKLPPFPVAQAQQMIEAEFGQPISALFSEFSEPVAAASIAQVHHARLTGTGAEVAVKVLRPGGRLMVLEFSQIPNEMMQKAYDLYSFNLIPVMGQIIANDRDSYQYLVESIRKFPDQETFAGMIRKAGFGQVKYRNLSLGIAALHSGWKI